MIAVGRVRSRGAFLGPTVDLRARRLRAGHAVLRLRLRQRRQHRPLHACSRHRPGDAPSLGTLVTEAGTGDEALVIRGERGPILTSSSCQARPAARARRSVTARSGNLPAGAGPDGDRFFNELATARGRLDARRRPGTNPTPTQVDDRSASATSRAGSRRSTRACGTWAAARPRHHQGAVRPRDACATGRTSRRRTRAPTSIRPAPTPRTIGIVDAHPPRARRPEPRRLDPTTRSSPSTSARCSACRRRRRPRRARSATSARPLDDLVLRRSAFLLNPLKQAIAEVKALIKDFFADIILQRFGLDIEQFELLLEFGTKMDVASVERHPDLQAGRPREDGRLPGHLSHPSPLETSDRPAGRSSSSTRARRRDHPNVEYDKTKFKPYANAVVLSKMLLLQETDPLAGRRRAAHGLATNGLDGVGTPMPTYDWNELNIVGDHGGNVMTTTLPIATLVAKFDPTTDIVTLPTGPSIVLGGGHNLQTARRRDLRAGRRTSSRVTVRGRHTQPQPSVDPGRRPASGPRVLLRPRHQPDRSSRST